MAEPLAPVKPGDLITADQWNLMIQEIQSLKRSVAELAAADRTQRTPLITGVAGTLRIGEEITVIGRNLMVDGQRPEVTLDTVRVRKFRSGTGPSSLVFTVPALKRVPKETQLKVANKAGSSSTTVMILPREKPGAEANVWIPDFEDIIREAAGGLVRIPIDLDHWGLDKADYKLEAVFSDPEGDADVKAWKANSMIVDEQLNLAETVSAESGDRARRFLTVRVPAGAKTVAMELVATSPGAAGAPSKTLKSRKVSIRVPSRPG